MDRFHFIGIGGIGMSALAGICIARGKVVSGSDLKENALLKKLSGKGADIYYGHSADNISSDVEMVIRSSCITDDNPELKKARELNIPVIFRSDMLKQLLSETPQTIAVTGTHGKTTTTALIAYIMDRCGKDPTVFVGGEMDHLGGNLRCGDADLLISEVDESDGLFRDIKVANAVLTNIEREHIENYGSMENLVGAYTQFITNIASRGVFVYNGEDVVLRGIASSSKAQKADFGIDGPFMYSCKDAVFDRSISFKFTKQGREIGSIQSSLVGRHNVMNILAALSMCMEMGLDLKSVSEALKSFRNVRRRFDLVGKVGTIEVIEDYAHHPTEVRSLIEAARGYGKGRVVTIFQPHRYSRTRDLADLFSDCFYGSEVLILTDIYSAGEEVKGDIRINDIYETMDKDRFEIIDLVRMERIPEYVADVIRSNDTVLVVGAGDIREISERLVDEIKTRTQNWTTV